MLSDLIAIVEESVDKCLKEKSTLQYQRSWALFHDFQRDTGLGGMSLPIRPHYLSLFVAYLLRRGYAPSTVKSHLSAIGFSHRILGLEFNSESFLINKMLLVAKQTRPLTERRLPITMDMIDSMLDRAKVLIPSYYVLRLFTAMCLTAFYAFMRSGEFTESDNNVQFKSLFISPLLDHATITFYKFKHMTSDHPWPVRIDRKPGEKNCPVIALRDYVRLRGQRPGPLFCLPNGAPVKRLWFSRLMACCLAHLPVDHERYKPHSFRIGAATAALQRRLTHDEICTLGRWSSRAFKNYVRLCGLTAL